MGDEEVQAAPRKRKVVKRVPIKKTTATDEIKMGDVEDLSSDRNERKTASPQVMLERGHNRLQLINDLAEGTYDNTILAAKYRVKPGDISKFQVKYKYDIDEQKVRVEKNLLDEYAQLAVAKKVNRIAIYQEQIRLCDEYIAWCETTNRHIPPAIMKLQQTALRSVAEEMGDLKTNVTIEQTMVEHVINGIDPKDLK